MRRALARTITYSVIAALAYGALHQTPPEVQSPGVLLANAAAARIERVDTLARGESLATLLGRWGLSNNEAALAIRSATMLDPRRIPAGMPVTLRSASADSAPSEVLLELAIDRILHIRRADTSWSAEEELLPWTSDTIIVQGTISSNLYAAMDSGTGPELSASARIGLANQLAELYDYRVNMSRDLQPGDNFRVLAERLVGPRGVEKISKILAASMTLSGKLTSAVRFENQPAASAVYYDQDGKAMRSGFLQFPIEFKRVSSSFGMRAHPILGVTRQHSGVDYAAPSGTPVRVIGDGVVTFAGVRGGYGNMIEVRHPNGFVSRYGHMRGFAQGIHAGSRVLVEEVIGYVGMTGLATGPHLHFEVLVGGVARNPTTALRNVGTEPIPAALQDQFAVVRDERLATLAHPAGRVSLAAF